MKTTHTRAPWQLANATPAGRFVGSGPDGVLGIAMAFGDTPEEQDANARLIAAAPELLAALDLSRQFINAVLENGERWRDVFTKNTGWLAEQVERAIAKAGGQS
jgi:hypothetical protein